MDQSLVGQRRSFDGQLCTIRYVGNVQGTSGDWLGVEWDDATRGKHAGEHKGVRYFTCQSKYPTAGSFVRPSRRSDLPRSFLEALREKYASEFEREAASQVNPSGKLPARPIEISGKVVEEVGFDKIRKQLAELQELRIVLLDGLRISGVLSSYEQPEDQVDQAVQEIATTCPQIIELDLSRSLLTSWRHVWQICSQLKKLRKLKVNGNRFHALEDGLVFDGITELHLEETLLSWEEIVAISSRFPALTSLTASGNQLSKITQPLPGKITKLNLENNEISTLTDIQPLSQSSTLEHLSLRGNNINKISHTDTTNSPPPFQFPNSTTSLDLSRNKIPDWSFLNTLNLQTPSLSTLRISGNPLYDLSPLPPAIASATSSTSSSNPMTVDESFMLTLSRFGSGLRTLNFSHISPQDRSNAEMYYLSLIGKELSATPVSEENMRLESHPRFEELCELYGRPNVLRAVVRGADGGRVIHPRSVAARLVRMAFRLWKSGDGDENSNSKTQGDVQRREIPISLDSYQVKAIVSRIYDLEPYSFKLVWETDEFDPVEKSVEGVTDWDYEDENEDEDEMREVGSTAPATSDKSRFVRREVELVESTRDIGFLFQGEVGEVRIRVEVDV